MYVELVLNNFINMRVNTKSRDCFSDLFTEHASDPYSKTGTHLALTRCSIISSEARRPSLPNIELNERYI